jgi:hypothetical protein
MKIKYFFFAVLGSLFVAACIKQDFDEPDISFVDPNIQTNSSIAELKSMFSLSEDEMVLMSEELVFDATVVANDKSGNIYQEIIVQDETGGLVISIDAYDLFTKFPVGRKVYVKCQGLYLANDEGVHIIGDLITENIAGQLVEVFDAIPDALYDAYLIDGRVQQPIAPKVVTINGLSNSLMSTLIQLDDVEFTNSDAGKPFADGVGTNKSTLNRNLEDCNENQVVVRSSGYSTFANEATPVGKGSLVAILSNFGTTRQLYIRDLDDLHMDGNRCGQGGTEEGIVEDFESQSNNSDINLFGWNNIATKGDRLWRGKEFDGNTYAQATAFNDTNPEMEAWLISPEVDFSVAKELEFRSAVAFYTHDGLEVLYSSDFDGFNPGAATWETISCPLAGSSDNNYDWVSSGVIDMSSFTNKGYVAFKYSGNSASNTASYIVDDIRIQDK